MVQACLAVKTVTPLESSVHVEERKPTMEIRARETLILTILLTVVGCMPIPTKTLLTPVTDLTKPIEFQGFSILPPNGENWFISGQNKYKVLFVKRLDSQSSATNTKAYGLEAQVRTFFVSPQLKTHKEILEHIDAEKKKNVNAGERLLTFNSSSMNGSLGSDCLKYDWKLEDRGVPVIGRAAIEVFIREEHGFTCLHPNYPQYVVELAYGQRYLEGKQLSIPGVEVESFLKSLKFNRLEKPFVSAILPMSAPQGMVLSHGTLWVVEMDKNRVSRIDPNTNTIVTTISVGKNPVGVVADKNAVWVVNADDADDGTVSKIDPNTNKITATIRVGRRPLSTIASESAVWVTNSNDDTVMRINPQTNKVVATIKVGKSPSGVAVGEGFVWVTNYRSHTVSKIDPVTNKVVATIATGKNPMLVLLDQSAVWVTNAGSGSVSRIDPKTNAAVDEIYIGGSPAGLTSVQGTIWITSWGNNNIVRIDPRINRIIGDPISIGNKPLCVIGDEKAIWVGNLGDNNVMRIEL